MKQLTCEMCGSTDIVKQEGIFVCQICGTKYSVEEAKKMMVEGIVEVTGTVKVDSTEKIKNYFEMAESAYKADNKSEAEAYCNRIIEIDPQNYKAWFIKGKVAGWQSSIANQRINESVQCFSKAIDYAPTDKKEDIKSEAAKEASNLFISLVLTSCENFSKMMQTEDLANSIIECATKVKEYALQLFNKCGVTPDKYEQEIATCINNTAVNTFSDVIMPEYENDNGGHPSEYALNDLIEKAGYCSSLIKAAIDFSDNDDLGNSDRYKNLIEINNYCINSCSWTKEFGYENAAQGALGGIALLTVGI